MKKKIYYKGKRERKDIYSKEEKRKSKEKRE
jgi:hypothetical protein